MDIQRTLRVDAIPPHLLSHLDTRDAALWVLEPFVDEAGPASASAIIGLPWRLVLSESSNPEVLRALERAEDPGDPLVRRRGYVHLVDINPAQVLLPPHCLPVYLLNGRVPDPTKGLAALTRRLTMLDDLRRAQVKELVILAGSGPSLPTELAELWNDGLRTLVTVVSNAAATPVEVEAWRTARPFGTAVAYTPIAAKTFSKELVEAYLSGQADDRVILRMRNIRGDVQPLDITGLDDPEHPLLSNYELLRASDLRHFQATDLRPADIEGFFGNPANSWRPYAAGMPWERNSKTKQTLFGVLKRLDKEGPEAGRVAYIASESGAGGTTLMRSLAWAAAQEGYPTLVARPAPFKARALSVATYMTRIIAAHRAMLAPEGEKSPLYETPWLIVFDNMHWDGHAEELRNFLRELEVRGRAACILVVTGPYIDPNFYDNRRFTQVANLSHEVSVDDALALGKHLNKFLAVHGSTRTDNDWRGFYDASAVQASRGIAAFWIALSFWVQHQFDMKETVQSWIYRQFTERVKDPSVRAAILNIAALSTERILLPESLLPPTTDWPISQKIEDLRKEVPALGLARISREGDRYWALAHDVIGRYLLTAIFYDTPAREAAGLRDAVNPEHLRFSVLRRLSKNPALGHVVNREIAEEFAVSIFKIDPDHGHANFLQFWREALDALDEMPRALLATSRTFRHHVAISRRRLSKLTDVVPLEPSERINLLERAARDIRYALENIPATPDSETDLNLYNSLAHAYQDLADEEIARGGNSKRVAELRALAHEALQRAYRTDPDNSFVVETYARSLLSDARDFPEKSAENAIEVLNIVYSAMDRDKSGQRRLNLSKLADKAMSTLLGSASLMGLAAEPTNDIDALVRAIRALAANRQNFEGMSLSDFAVEGRTQAAAYLAHPLLLGNAQAVRLRYALCCIDQPTDFQKQLELLQSLEGGGTTFSPQMRLELAVLLHQCDRHHEGERLFRGLRRLWREGEHYVEVPDRLRWLLAPDRITRRQVTARVLQKAEFRRAAKVREMLDIEVLFRPQEFGQQEFPPGTTIRGLVTFGHNGPFLRPTTAPKN
jgi:tetratricopeptide (TPR) repeat protein